MQQTLRAFVAVMVPDAVAVFIRQVQAQLQLPGMNIRWVAAKNIHLTLKFLGDMDPSRVPEVAAQMDAAAGTIRPFSLAAKGVGVFPNLRRARVLWVGLTGDLDRLKAIQATLESGLESVGFRREPRDFGAHLTIGRIRERTDAKMIGASMDQLKDTASDGFHVDRLVLFKSILKPNGPEYSLLHTSHLAI
ncbi:RNA 2',3'-cyclic phosphodiesterase [uncultured Desulfosarcina sp.]|uniref:RNA 2',3'-cyclic phosphodiesterase n=1 Tax=uncultured Desulfosarcina sp. TaxID=218289 RepID=UPI0029C79245|nr:RNA 2',3'-cyclic phosphodiesterase [uncultured Desulfosarcina sp.]